jgi:hypothetical protein
VIHQVRQNPTTRNLGARVRRVTTQAHRGLQSGGGNKKAVEKRALARPAEAAVTVVHIQAQEASRRAARGLRRDKHLKLDSYVSKRSDSFAFCSKAAIKQAMLPLS